MEVTTMAELIQTLGIPLGFAVIFLVALYAIIKTIYKDSKEEKTKLIEQMALTAKAVDTATTTNKELSESNKELIEKVNDKLDTIIKEVSK